MNIIVSEVYDTERFAWFMHLKYGFNLSYIKMLSTCINEKDKYSFINLTEEEVRYLQATNSCRSDSEYICKLKIIPMRMPLKRKQNFPTYLDNEGKLSESIDITASCDNEPQSSSFELYSVTYTKVIENKEALNMHQITALLNDPNVKSINIKK